MNQLVLRLGGKRCTLTASELMTFPESLLAHTLTLAPSENSGDTATGKDSCQMGALHGATFSSSILQSVMVDLDHLPENPLSAWPQALDMLPALYRDKCIPLSFIEQMLASETRDSGPSSSSSSRSGSHNSYLALYGRLSLLLQYLGIQSPLSDMLPAMDSITVNNSHAWEFSHACIAADAGHLMLKFKPHSVPDSFCAFNYKYANTAAFLVTVDEESRGLKVYLVGFSNWQQAASLSSAIESVFAKKGGSEPSAVQGPRIAVIRRRSTDDTKGLLYYNSISMDTTQAWKLPIESNDCVTLAELSPQQQLGTGKIPKYVYSRGFIFRTAVGLSPSTNYSIHPGIGKQLAQALQAGSDTGVRIAVCSVNLRCRDPRKLSSKESDMYVPLWILQWGM